MTRTIQVEHLGRVEGHGGITVVLDGRDVTRVEFDIFEGLRFFEELVRGRNLQEVPVVVSRICSICSHAHALTSVMAIEQALGVETTAQTRLLRDLAMQGGNIESHALHAFALALPDFLGVAGLAEIARKHPEATALALRLKKLGNTVQEVVGGRAVHPVTYVPGGFTRAPRADDLADLRRRLEAGLDDCERAVDFWSGVELPSIGRGPIRCAALIPDDEAFLFGTTLGITDGPTIPVREYRRLTNEHAVPHSHAKHSAHDGRSYMLGALARLTLNGLPASPLARAAADRLGLEIPADSVLENNLAQVVEMVASVERALDVVRRLLEDGIAAEDPVEVAPRAGDGAAATEAPRGTLFHRYEFDSRGRVVSADVITPTSQNLRDAEERLRAAAKEAPEAADAELARRFEMVCRAYDPCISCSVHVVRAG